MKSFSSYSWALEMLIVQKPNTFGEIVLDVSMMFYQFHFEVNFCTCLLGNVQLLLSFFFFCSLLLLLSYYYHS